MRRYRRNNEAIGITIILLIIPLFVYWKEILIITVLVLVAKVIYHVIKILTVTKEDDITFLGDVVQLDEEECNKGSNPEYEAYINDKYVKKGIEAEQKITRILRRIFPKENIIHDSYFQDNEQFTTQVDVIAIDTSGIYIIESKAYSSIVSGKTNQKMWIQLFAGKKYQKFSNPIIQNKRHVNAIKKELEKFELPDKVFKSYVVFDDKCKLNIVNNNCDAKVIQQKDLFYTILEDRKTTESILTTSQIENIVRIFRIHADVDDSFKMQHVIRMQNNIKYMK